MMNKITEEHRLIFEQTRKSLTNIGAKESNFLKVEILFYDMISIARMYGEDLSMNRFLAALKQLQMNEYKETKSFFKKSSQRERVIRRFISQLKSILSTSCKNEYVVLAGT